MKLISKGFFILIFTCLLAINSKAQKIQHEENWNFYITEYDSLLISNFLDLELVKIAPILQADQLLSIKIKLKYPQENGLSSNEEFDDLNKIEDKLIEILNDINLIYYAGRSTANGFRIFYFYTDQNFNLETNNQHLKTNILNYDLDISLENDKEWNHYLTVLFPDEEEMQMIQNLDLITYIEDQGDDLSKEREVYHWLYFKTKNDRANFIKEIISTEFKIISEDYHKDIEDYKYSLTISRIDYIDWESINDIVISLMRLSKQNNGEYDGWETSLEK